MEIGRTASRRAALLAAALAACSDSAPYRYVGDDNVEVRSSLDGARASLHVHRLGEQCRTRYEGSVALDAPIVTLAIPPEEASVLVLSFEPSSFAGGSRGPISRELTLRPRPGHRYRIDARYRNVIADVTALEITRGTDRSRPLELGLDCTVAGK